jgi:hypothetical protein
MVTENIGLWSRLANVCGVTLLGIFHLVNLCQMWSGEGFGVMILSPATRSSCLPRSNDGQPPSRPPHGMPGAGQAIPH